MPKRSSRDITQIAFAIVQQSTEQAVPTVQTFGPDSAGAVQASGRVKNPAAVALGRLGGLKGGLARAKSLSKTRRKEIAKAAALKRWSSK